MNNVRVTVKRIRRLKLLGRLYKIRNRVMTTLSVIGVISLGFILVDRRSEPLLMDPAAYTPLLNTIAKGESNGNYNAYYGNARNTGLRFTDMTVSEVLQWQVERVHQGNPSSAVGKYQIVQPTLAGLVQQLSIDPKTRYSEALQDRLAVALLERRGSLAFVAKELTPEQFAASLAKEWAALPRVVGGNPQESYYAGDGLNQSRISIEEVYAALEAVLRNSVSDSSRAIQQ